MASKTFIIGLETNFKTDFLKETNFYSDNKAQLSEECPGSVYNELFNYQLDQIEILDANHQDFNNLNSDIENTYIMLTAGDNLEKPSNQNTNINNNSNQASTGLTAAIENATDFAVLFRGLSSFEYTSDNVMPTQSLNTKQEPNNGLGEEKSFDIELLLRAQQQSEDKEKVLAQLSPVKMQEEEKFANIRGSSFTFNDSSLCDDSNCSSSTVASPKQNSNKRKLSIESNVSSCSTLNKTNEQPPAKKRGRRPVAASEGAGAPKSKYSKESTEDKTLVYFGNKKVEIGTDEYRDRRKSNNEAVKKCREKAEKEQQEREIKMKGLVDENNKLSEKVTSLQKELEVLKGIIITMRTDNKLPDSIQKMMNSI